MSILPAEAEALLLALAPVFTEPTFHRFVMLLAGALLTTGRRTIANLLRTLGGLAPGHPTTYQRVLSSAHWSGLRLACAFCRFLLQRWAPSGPIPLVGDDTVESHPGRKVYGKARHRDPVRSSHSFTAWRYGHKWVVLAVLVRFPFARRPWALPVLVDLYRSAADNQARRRPHRTPAQLMIRLLRLMLRWFPDRSFVFVGDAGYGTHEVARFAYRRRDRLTLVSKLHPDANLFQPPPPYAGKGRPRVKGARLPKPRQAVAQTSRLRQQTVPWYGGGQRPVRLASGAGCWYKAGAVPRDRLLAQTRRLSDGLTGLGQASAFDAWSAFAGVGRRRLEQVGVGVQLADQRQPVAATVGEASDLVRTVAGVADEHKGAVGEPAQHQTQQSDHELGGGAVGTTAGLVVRRRAVQIDQYGQGPRAG